MKIRFIRLTAAIVGALGALVLFGALVSLAAPGDPLSRAGDITGDAETGTTVRARRAISIPFGITSTLTLSQDGHQVEVVGHGTCQEGGEVFILWTTVTQESNEVAAQGRTEGGCQDGAALTWTAEVDAQEPPLFEPGPARACAMAIVFMPQGDDINQIWCKDVTLAQQAY